MAVSDGLSWSRPTWLVICSETPEVPGAISPRYAIAFLSWTAARALAEISLPWTPISSTVNEPALEPACLSASFSASSTSLDTLSAAPGGCAATTWRVEPVTVTVDLDGVAVEEQPLRASASAPRQAHNHGPRPCSSPTAAN